VPRSTRSRTQRVRAAAMIYLSEASDK
jgi:hypothetical protein